MAVTNLCDGCGAQADLSKVGDIRPKEYCEQCARAAQMYLRELDEIHDLAVRTFLEGQEELDNEFKKLLNTLPNA